jgi:hypothetical protein
MAIQNINIGSSPNDGTGDSLREAFIKTEANTIELNNKNYSPTVIAPFYQGIPAITAGNWEFLMPVYGHPASAEEETTTDKSYITPTSCTITKIAIAIEGNVNSKVGIVKNIFLINSSQNSNNVSYDWEQTLTPSGRYTCHSYAPNISLIALDNFAVAVQSVDGDEIGLTQCFIQISF